jgi:hypothetical protein
MRWLMPIQEVVSEIMTRASTTRPDFADAGAARLLESFSDLLDAIKRVWTALKKRFSPSQPIPVPARIRR